MLIGVVANFIHLDPIRGLIYAAVANGIIAPIILFFVVRLSGDKKLMGKHANRPHTSLIGWVTILIMAAAGVAAIASMY
jgi:Mn2+/Fe2+ NRAMP family transporter